MPINFNALEREEQHLKEPRTYVKHFWRNSQMKLVMLALEEFSGGGRFSVDN